MLHSTTTQLLKTIERLSVHIKLGTADMAMVRKQLKMLRV